MSFANKSETKEEKEILFGDKLRNLTRKNIGLNPDSDEYFSRLLEVEWKYIQSAAEKEAERGLSHISYSFYGIHNSDDNYGMLTDRAEDIKQFLLKKGFSKVCVSPETNRAMLYW